eukprot:jgi/Chlat1/8492/Chrsp80S00652
MAELFLLRNDLIQVSTTSHHTLRVLPVGKNVQQKAFSIKKGELVTAFKTIPTGQPVTRIVLGSGLAQGDKIFVASGQAIRGLAKKGKEFFRFDTNLTETINSIYVQELAVLTGGEYIYNYFQDCKDINFYLAHDRINDMTAVSIGKDGQLNPGSNLYYEAAVGGPITCVEKYATRSADICTTRDVIYGTQNGELGLLTMEPDSIRRGWVISATDPSSGGVSCICTRVDLTKDGANSIVVGRDNGDIEVYSVTNGESRLRVKKNIGESVLSIDCGCISTPGADDIVVLAFSGKVIAFSCSADGATATANQQAEKKLKAMKKDLDALQERLVQEKERLLAKPQAEVGLAAMPAASREAGLKATLKSSFSPADMAYTLSVETQMPIGSIAVQCDIEVELLNGAGNSGIMITRCPPDKKSGCATLAICHTQEPTNRMSVSFKAAEGQSATMSIYPIPRVSPRTCAPVHFHLRPLCLHQRVTELPQPQPRPMSELRITGAFSHSEMHAWIANCLPDIPGRAPADDSSEYMFVSTMLGTALICQNRQGSAVFKSENVTTLAVVKEIITKEADARKVRINATVTVDDNTLACAVDLLDKTLSQQSLFKQQVQLLEALQEVKMQEEDMSYFAPEYLDILKGADTIRHGYSPQKLQSVHDIVKTLFVDWHKFKGLNVRSKLPQLEHILSIYSKDLLSHFMEHAS